MSFRAPRSMMARRGVAIKTRSLPMKKKKKERERKRQRKKEEGTDRKNREEKPRGTFISDRVETN